MIRGSQESNPAFPWEATVQCQLISAQSYFIEHINHKKPWWFWPPGLRVVCHTAIGNKHLLKVRLSYLGQAKCHRLVPWKQTLRETCMQGLRSALGRIHTWQGACEAELGNGRSWAAMQLQLRSQLILKKPFQVAPKGGKEAGPSYPCLPVIYCGLLPVKGCHLEWICFCSWVFASEAAVSQYSQMLGNRCDSSASGI